MKMDLIIVGVGGQGILLASRVLGHIAMQRGLDAKVSEVHGMSQRGGDVITHVRIGEEIKSPLIEEGKADAIIAFEQMEAARALHFLKKGGLLVINTQKINPMPVLTGAAEYPADIMKTLKEASELCALDALAIAEEAGATRAVNIVLLGAFARRQEFPKETWLEAISACVPKKTIEQNEKAFHLGWEILG